MMRTEVRQETVEVQKSVDDDRRMVVQVRVFRWFDAHYGDSQPPLYSSVKDIVFEENCQRDSLKVYANLRFHFVTMS